MEPKRDDYKNTKIGDAEYEEAKKEYDETISQVRSQISRRADEYSKQHVQWLENKLYFWGLTPKEALDIQYEPVYNDKGEAQLKKVRTSKSKIFSSLQISAISRINSRVPQFIAETQNKEFAQIATTLANSLNFTLKNSKIKHVLQELAKDYLDTGMCIVRYQDQELRAVNPFQFLASANWKSDIQDADWVAIRTLESREALAVKYPELREELLEEEDKFTYRRSYYGGSMFDYGCRQSKLLNPHQMSSIISEALSEADVEKYLGGLTDSVDEQDQIEHVEYWNKTDRKKYCLIGEEIVSEEDFEGDYPLAVATYLRDSSTAFPIALNTIALSLAKQADIFYHEHLHNILFHTRLQLAVYDKSKLSSGLGKRQIIAVDSVGTASSQNDIQEALKIYQSGYSNQEALTIFREISNNLRALYGLASLLQGVSGGETTAREAQIKATESIANLEFIGRKMLDEMYTEIGKLILKMTLSEDGGSRIFEAFENDTTTRYLYIPNARYNSKWDVCFKFGGRAVKIHAALTTKELESRYRKSFEEDDGILGDPIGDGVVSAYSEYEEEVTNLETGMMSKEDFIESLKELSEGKIQGFFTNLDLDNEMLFVLTAVTGTTVNAQILLDKLSQLKMMMLQSQGNSENIDKEIFDQLGLGQLIVKQAPTDPHATTNNEIPGTEALQQDGMNVSNFARLDPESNITNNDTVGANNPLENLNPLGAQT